jgi:hypothetical protein
VTPTRSNKGQGKAPAAGSTLLEKGVFFASALNYKNPTPELEAWLKQ